MDRAILHQISRWLLSFPDRPDLQLYRDYIFEGQVQSLSAFECVGRLLFDSLVSRLSVSYQSSIVMRGPVFGMTFVCVLLGAGSGTSFAFTMLPEGTPLLTSSECKSSRLTRLVLCKERDLRPDFSDLRLVCLQSALLGLLVVRHGVREAGRDVHFAGRRGNPVSRPGRPVYIYSDWPNY